MGSALQLHVLRSNWMLFQMMLSQARLVSPLTHAGKSEFTVSQAPVYAIDLNPKRLHVWFEIWWLLVYSKVRQISTAAADCRSHYVAPQFQA